MTTTALPFNIDTCEQDFAGPERTVEVCKGRHGFHVKFDNGWVISIQFGLWHYRTGRELNTFDFDSPAPASRDAEVAAWKGKGGMIQMRDHDTVAGWQSVEHVRAALDAAAADDEDGIVAALSREDES